MEILGGLLIATILLTLLGSMALLALASMAVLGLLTEMSFKRVFVVSCGIGLLAPIALGLAVSSMVNDEGFQQEFLAEVNQAVSGSETVMEALPRIRELRQQLSDGTITRDQFEEQLEQLIEERTGAQIELEGVEVTPEAEAQADLLPEGE